MLQHCAAELHLKCLMVHCAAEFPLTYPLRRRVRFDLPSALGGAAAPWLSLWESWHGVAVTERVYVVANMERVS